MYKVAILVYDGVYLLDFCGPLEVFHDTMLDKLPAFEVILVAPTKHPIKSHTNTIITPDDSIDNCLKPDILVIPGGDLSIGQSNPKVGKWIQESALFAKITLSVCTGAFILAELGMLNGLKATTWYGALDHLQKKYPLIHVVKDQRITDNGSIITTAGVSAGIDGALHVVSKLINRETARKTAEFIEYSWIQI